MARRLGIGRSTVLKYAEGDPKALSEIGFQSGKLGQYLADCLICFNHGLSKKETIHYITQKGCHVPKRTVYDYLSKIETAAERKFALHGHYKHRTTELPHLKGSKGGQADYVTREMIFRFLWFNEPLEEAHHAYLFQYYPMLHEIKSCIQSFRQIYECENMPFLYLFIDKHLASGIVSFKSFAKGLLKDFEAVENSVASPLSNGFVEGVNNKLKMIKRTMYGRGSLQVLRAKLMLKI